MFCRRARAKFPGVWARVPPHRVHAPKAPGWQEHGPHAAGRGSPRVVAALSRARRRTPSLWTVSVFYRAEHDATCPTLSRSPPSSLTVVGGSAVNRGFVLRLLRLNGCPGALRDRLHPGSARAAAPNRAVCCVRRPTTKEEELARFALTLQRNLVALCAWGASRGYDAIFRGVGPQGQCGH